MPVLKTTYWTYEITNHTGKRRPLVIVPADTLEAALAEAFKDVTYYIGVCGYQVSLRFLELCASCRGTGLLHVRRGTRLCSKCKGKPVLREVAETIWTPNEAIIICDRSGKA